MTNQNLSIALSALARGPPPFSEVEFKPLSGMRAGVKQGRCLLVVAPTFQEVNFDSISPLANSQSVAQPYAI